MLITVELAWGFGKSFMFTHSEQKRPCMFHLFRVVLSVVDFFFTLIAQT